MLGGAIVPFHSMHPGIAKKVGVPWPAQTMISRWGFEALTTMYAADNAFTSPLFGADQDMAQAEFLRDRWVPEMKRQVDLAEDGNANAIAVLARGFQRHHLATSIDVADGVNSEEALFLARQLDGFRNRQRDAWLKAKAERDSILNDQGWGNPASAKAIKQGELNHALEGWTTGADILSTGFALDYDDIHNTRDALYAHPQLPGSGPFHSARSWMGYVVPKWTANWTVLWISTLIMMAGLVIWGTLRPQGRPRRT